MKDIRQRLLATFQVEHREHVQHIRQTLESLRRTLYATGHDEFRCPLLIWQNQFRHSGKTLITRLGDRLQ